MCLQVISNIFGADPCVLQMISIIFGADPCVLLVISFILGADPCVFTSDFYYFLEQILVFHE